MNGQRIFPGMLLIGFGIYFFLQQSAFGSVQAYLGWPALLLITGTAFLVQGYKSDGSGILPGVVLTGFSAHFYGGAHWGWPENNTGMFLLVLAIGFLLQHQKAGGGLLYGLLFLVLAAVTLFHGSVTPWLQPIQLIWPFWPFLLIAAGGYFLFVQKSSPVRSRKI